MLVFACLFSAFVSCALGVFVLAKNSASRVNRLFFALMAGMTYWALGEYLLWTADSPDGLSFWLHASAFWPLVIAIGVYFILTFTDRWPVVRKSHPWLIHILLFLPAIIFSLIGLCTDMIFTRGYQPGIGWVYAPAWQSTVYLASGLYVIVIMIWATYATLVSWQQAEREKIRQQNRFVCIGMVNLLFYGTLSGIILPGFGIYIPNLVFIGEVVFSIIIVYAIQRYGLFTLSPETAVPDILRTLPDGVILTDPEGKIIVANAAASKILGIAEKELPGQETGDLLPAKVIGEVREALVSRGTISDVEVSLPGREYAVGSIAGTVVRDPSGEIAGFVLIVRDITDRKAAEMSLRVANEKISILTQMTRHDISNLLTALSAYQDLIREKNHNPEIGPYLATCTGIVEKISRHLQFSREYQEIGSHEPAWQQLEWLISRGIAAFPHEGIAIAVNVDPVEIYTDPLAFKVMYNLFENAVRHGGPVTRFEVSSKKEPDGSLTIVFKDDGCGIRNEDKQKIFEYGYGSHTGIGLSLSRDILLMTGITIAETGEPGKGACFEIRVPAGTWRSARVRTW